MSGLPSWARVGAKVVCVADGPYSCIRRGPTVYTVEHVSTYAGVVHITVAGACELAHRFRPAVEPKSEAHDLALFRKLLRQPELVE